MEKCHLGKHYEEHLSQLESNHFMYIESKALSFRIERNFQGVSIIGQWSFHVSWVPSVSPTGDLQAPALSMRSGRAYVPAG